MCAYSKRTFREFLGFFFEACYLEEKDTLSEFECMEHYSVDAVYIQMLTITFFQFALNSRYQGTIFVMFSALVSPCPCCYWRCLLTLFRMAFSGLLTDGGGGTAKRPPSLKSVTPIVQWWNLAQLYLTQGRSKKYMNHVTYSLSSADISSFSQEINKFSYIKKYRYRLHFDALFLFILTFLESL